MLFCFGALCLSPDTLGPVPGTDRHSKIAILSRLSLGRVGGSSLGTIVPQGASEKHLCVLCLLVSLALKSGRNSRVVFTAGSFHKGVRVPRRLVGGGFPVENGVWEERGVGWGQAKELASQCASFVETTL